LNKILIYFYKITQSPLIPCESYKKKPWEKTKSAPTSFVNINNFLEPFK